MPTNGEAATRKRLPGDILLHPAVVASLALLLLNDLFLKSAHPGPVSWKLSDFAGLAFFPALIFAMCEVLASGARRRRVLLTPSRMWSFAGLSAISFALIKMIPAVGEMAERANDMVIEVVVGSRDPTVFTPDPTDLLALPAVLIAVWVGYRMRD